MIIKLQQFTRYQKLHIVKLFERKFLGKTMVHETPFYYEVFSSALGGRCGHRHRTHKAAQPCLDKMQRMMHAKSTLTEGRDPKTLTTGDAS